MNSPLAIVLLSLAIICVFVAIGNFSEFWKKGWFSRELDVKSLVLTFISAFVFLSIFFYMEENT
ncbi:hypothetical protein J3L16_09650 [Alteromonas sp. 5E99-2]|uniref:hypothetical protein n=1 Tax=Alteromonas sp. 5E99-2 TaxID=2817683 RepID=UPI001A98EC50|nr:hypothetical protein [Alteromonas sp. 5E99-2]MBO1255947.1 hypothetical protein [Alteromonas sp. 5E99-2]